MTTMILVSLTIPLALLGDFFLGKYTTAQAILGGMLVLCSFVIVGLGSNTESEQREIIDNDDSRRVLEPSSAR